MKEYWGEGSARARNWQRYDLGERHEGLAFEEGVDSYVPYAGSLKDGRRTPTLVQDASSTMCNCGALSIKELSRRRASRSSRPPRSSRAARTTSS